MGKAGRGVEVTGVTLTIPISSQKYHGQDPQPEIAYPNGKHLCGRKSVESTGTRLAELLLSFYKKRSE
jgi:hypothetical protein